MIHTQLRQHEGLSEAKMSTAFTRLLAFVMPWDLLHWLEGAENGMKSHRFSFSESNHERQMR